MKAFYANKGAVSSASCLANAEADEICKAEPLVVGGYATYKLVGLQIANRENNYLL
ncbi:MAG: hypothetical protein HFE71_02285 [Emergencia sp.]|nr:hypothetical protein [Emergencia sp.]